MGGMSLWHWMIVLVVVLLLFGSGRLSAVMGDAAKGIKAFKKGMADDDTPPSPAHLTQAPPVYSPPPAHVQPATYSPVVEPFAPAGQPLAPAPAMQPAPGTEPHRP